MSVNDRIRQTIVDFVKAGENSDVELLQRVLRKDFSVSSDGLIGTVGVTIINKQEYLEKIRSKVFGGLPRKMQILDLDQSGNIASVKLRIESEGNDLISFNHQ